MKKATLILILLLSITAVFAQSKTKKPNKVIKPQSAIYPAPQISPDPGHKITITLPDGDMTMLIGSAKYGFQGYIMTTPVPANQLDNVSKYYNDVYSRVVNQFNYQIKIEQDSIVKAEKQKADSVKNKPPVAKQ